MEDGEKTKPVIAARERGPGPGRYGLPSTCGYPNHDSTKRRNPAYSFGYSLKDDSFKKDCSPGPGYFIEPKISRHGTDGTPAYSILGRQRDQNTFKTPSPGTYSPEKVHPQGEKRAPAHSMAGRTRYRKRDAVPSPNSYSLPSLMGSKIANKKASAAYSMTSRSQTGCFSEDLARTPGPGRYNTLDPNTLKGKAPAYSLLGRNNLPGDSTQKPGPGAHTPEKVVVNRKAAPSFSLGIRHSEFVTPLIVEIAE